MSAHLQKNFNPNKHMGPSPSNDTPLIYAVRFEHKLFLNECLRFGGDPFVSNTNGQTAFHVACASSRSSQRTDKKRKDISVLVALYCWYISVLVALYCWYISVLVALYCWYISVLVALYCWYISVLVALYCWCISVLVALYCWCISFFSLYLISLNGGCLRKYSSLPHLG